MGGPGSGKWFYPNRRTTTEETRRIDIRDMRKRGLLIPGCTGEFSWSIRDRQIGTAGFRVEQDQLILKYRHRSENECQDIEEQIIWFDRTPCNYGRERLWFLCPHCGKRVAVLYGTGSRFLCRHCCHLTYGSQNEVEIKRMMRKSWKIRRRLGASESLDEPIWVRPKGMHQKTFDRLVREEGRANFAVSSLMDGQLGMLRKQFAARS